LSGESSGSSRRSFCGSGLFRKHHTKALCFDQIGCARLCVSAIPDPSRPCVSSSG
jgi:hypothetical protein